MRISEWRIQPAGTRRGGGTGVLARTDRRSASRTGREPRFLRVPGRFWKVPAPPGPGEDRHHWTSLNLWSLWNHFGNWGGTLRGDREGWRRNVRPFPNRTASGDYNPKPVIVAPGTAAHLEGGSTPRTESTSLHIAAAHSPSRTRTPSSHSTRSPPSVFVFLRFLGSSVPTLLLLFYYFTCT